MICWFENHSNTIQYNPTHVFLSSSISNNKHGFPILNKESFRNSVSLFLSRSNTNSNWIIQPNVYLKPSKGNKLK
jgi:hypothetical protein